MSALICLGARACGVFVLAASVIAQDLAVFGKRVHTVSGAVIENGVVLVKGGKIVALGPMTELEPPIGMRTLTADVVTPGLIDAHCVIGLAGYLNQPQDQDQHDPAAPIQPELRALDAYNARERLIEWVREFGVTTIHTGHAPLALISGDTLIAKTRGDTVDEAVLVPRAMVAATLGSDSRAEGKGKSPGTAGKQLALLREALIGADEHRRTLAAAGDDATKRPDRDLRKEALVDVLEGRVPLLVTAHRHQDISSALRLAREFGFKLVLDGAAEAYVVLDELSAAHVPVIAHPPMARFVEDLQNASRTTPKQLFDAKIPFAFQSGYESYVPKTRVVLYEAAIAAAHGLGRDAALRAITLDAARVLGIDARVGSLEVGKDADFALYDGDPFEYTTHCVATVIDGVVVFAGLR
ncbi:MAG: amidohydrolase family protein [Planctomycetes bacterium]|nr:amidohydrolase family protein [Planctomycetota bacterium]